MQDLDDDEYGYTTRGAMCNKPKKDDLSLEFTFVDALEFYPYKHENPNSMINRVFSSPQGMFSLMHYNIEYFLYIYFLYNRISLYLR